MSTGISILLLNLVAGTIIIYTGNLNAVLIGLFTILWYNGIYTYSKRITAFAVVPGAANGCTTSTHRLGCSRRRIYGINQLFLLDFYFLQDRYLISGYLSWSMEKSIKKQEFQALTAYFSHTQINRLTFTWVVTSVIAAIFLCYFEIIENLEWLSAFFGIASAFLIWKFSGVVKDFSGEEL